VILVTLLLLGMMALRRSECRARAVLTLAGTLVLLTVRLLLGLPWLDGAQALTFPFAFAWWKLLPVLAGLLLGAAAAALKRHSGRAMSHGAIAAVVVALAVAALLAVYFVPVPGGNGLWELREILHGRPMDSFGSERIGAWRLTLEMSRDSLLFGTGPDTFLYAMDNHVIQTGQRLRQNFDNPHNMLLAILANNGLPAMLAFILFCGWVLIRGWQRMKDDPMVFVLLTAVLGYLAQGMFTFSICLVTPMFYAALGMLSACGGRRKEDVVT
jgi:O-antigen ligase